MVGRLAPLCIAVLFLAPSVAAQGPVITYRFEEAASKAYLPGNGVGNHSMTVLIDAPAMACGAPAELRVELRIDAFGKLYGASLVPKARVVPLSSPVSGVATMRVPFTLVMAWDAQDLPDVPRQNYTTKASVGWANAVPSCLPPPQFVAGKPDHHLVEACVGRNTSAGQPECGPITRARPAPAGQEGADDLLAAIPGPELVLLLAALGAAIMLQRKR